MTQSPANPIKFIFISVPSKGVFEMKEDGTWKALPRFLEVLANLHRDYPNCVFISPSIQNYQILPYLGDSGPTYEHWKDQCRALIKKCDEVFVLTFESWSTSVGVGDEIMFAEELRIPVKYISVYT